jgi:putative Mg2+ transporter-C (MgtC) family protein
MFEDLSVVIRLVAAAAAGGALGLPRNISDKPIGMRTLGLVSLGAAMVSVAALRYLPPGTDANATARVLQGLLQGLMVGVGFIGAGVIMRDTSTNKVHGLTTATTVWIAAALGIACGIADWLVAVTGLILSLVILIALKRVENRVTHEPEQQLTRWNIARRCTPG